MYDEFIKKAKYYWFKQKKSWTKTEDVNQHISDTRKFIEIQDFNEYSEIDFKPSNCKSCRGCTWFKR